MRQMGEGTSACPQGCLIHVLAYSNSQMRGYATGRELTDVQRRLMRICLDNNATSNSIRQEELGGLNPVYVLEEVPMHGACEWLCWRIGLMHIYQFILNLLNISRRIRPQLLIQV